MFELIDYVCSEERRKDILRQADTARMILRATGGPAENAYWRLLANEVRALAVHTYRLVRLTVQACASILYESYRSELGGT